MFLRDIKIIYVKCLGACEIAPMMQCNEEYVGPLAKEKIDEMIEKYS